MSNTTFSIREALKNGWELTKANLGFLIAFQAVIFGLGALHYFLMDGDYIWLSILSSIAITIVDMGYIKSGVLIVNGINPQFDQLYIHWKKFFTWFFASLFYGLMVGFGLILLVIPGLYFAGRYGLFGYFIVDKDYGPIESLQVSARATRGMSWKLLLYFIVMVLINLVGLALLGIGLFITIPVTMLGLATIYKKTQEVPTVLPER